MAEDELISTDGEIFDKKEDKHNQEEKVIEAKNFFSTQKKKLGLIAKHGESVVEIDFNELSEHSPEISEDIINKPEETLNILELALADSGLISDPRVRLESISKTQELKIRNIRAINLGKMISIEGIVRQASEVRPQVINARFECPSCGTILSIMQIEKKFQEPNRCSSCGRRGGFRILTKEMVDAQRLVLEESPDALSGGEQPKRMQVFLKEDLVDPKMEERTTPGSKVKVIGVLKEISLPLPTGIQTRFDLAIEANNVIPLEETFDDLSITEEEENQIKELATEPNIVEKLAKSISPSVWGYPEIKEALALQLFGGVQKQRSDGTKTRGDMHILLVGDPGVAKSVMLKFISTIAPKGRYVSGKSASGAGLCVSPNSLLMTNPGGMERVEDVVEDRLTEKKEYSPGVWRQKDNSGLKIQSMSNNLEIQSKKPDFIWKLKAPKKVFEVVLSSGKKIELTGNTQLFCTDKGETFWKKSSEIKEGDYIATPRKLIGGEIDKLYAVDLIDSNPVIHNIKDHVKRITDKLVAKYGSLRKASKELDINENNLYCNWVNERVVGNIKLNNLKKICEAVGEDYKEFVNELSLYNGKNHTIPKILTKDTLYLAGIIAGDGDIRKTMNGSFSVRFSNLNKELHKIYRDTLEKEFKLNYDIQKGNEKRPEATRANSKILAEILFKLGLCESPKSTKIQMSNYLLHCSNNLLGHFIAGLYDSDGSICLRKTKGSECIDLTTCSEKLARQLQLSLLRYEIHSTLRKRPASKGKIKGNFSKWVLEIRGTENFKKFKENIFLKHPDKKKKLDLLTEKNKEDTNVDIIPGIGNIVKDVLKSNKISLKKAGWHNNFSRKGLQKLLEKTNIKDEKLTVFAYNDIFWEKVKLVKEKESEYEFVYDLTVEKSHNFVVDGILVHNTATVVKDEFLRGWALEAGAMVLSNRGLLCIDELEKMDENDRSTMHEALEQQCMLPDFKLLLSDGREVEIGKLVDEKMNKNKDKIIIGEQCEILPVKDLELISTDFFNHFPIKADRISRHKAPKKFVKVTLANGREITVTPEHPCWIVKDGEITTISAEKLNEGMFFPIPSEISIKEKDYISENDLLCKILGYHITDGCYELNRGKKNGIQFWNNDHDLIEDYKSAIERFFKVHAGITKRRNQYSVRVISKKVVDYIVKLDPSLMEKGIIKTIPDSIMQLPKENLRYLLRAMFDGDGTVVLQNRNSCRATLITENRKLAEQVSDILLRFGIQSSIFKDRTFFKVDVSGQENLKRFLVNISFLSSKKKNRLKEYCEKDKSYKSIRDIIPNCTDKISSLFKKLNISMNKELGHSIDLGVEKHRKYLQKLILIVEKKLNSFSEISEEIRRDVENLKKLAFGYARWVKIKKIEEIKNKDIEWVYDVTIEPYKTFISNGMILHNTVTISKANVQATLNAKTAVLAAANPKFGRFDPTDMIAKQVNLAPSLLNRFDVLFILRDLPDRERDEKIASHVLSEHKQDFKPNLIDRDLLRKYIAYAHQKYHPVLSSEAAEKIKKFYVGLRNQSTFSSSDTINKPIPISARQLEALVRLAEANAKARLSKTVDIEDADRAIKLVQYYMMQVGYDEETKSFDIDKISGNPASKRGKVFLVKEILEELENKFGKLIPQEELEKAVGEKMKKAELEEAIDKLLRAGDIFRPRRGYLQRV
jgi:replicative DNA helicase Mcm